MGPYFDAQQKSKGEESGWKTVSVTCQKWDFTQAMLNSIRFQVKGHLKSKAMSLQSAGKSSLYLSNIDEGKKQLSKNCVHMFYGIAETQDYSKIKLKVKRAFKGEPTSGKLTTSFSQAWMHKSLLSKILPGHNASRAQSPQFSLPEEKVQSHIRFLARLPNNNLSSQYIYDTPGLANWSGMKYVDTVVRLESANSDATNWDSTEPNER